MPKANLRKLARAMVQAKAKVKPASAAKSKLPKVR